MLRYTDAMQNNEYLIINQQIHYLPYGYTISLVDNEKSHRMTVSTGEIRQDIYKKGFKIKLNYKNLLEDSFKQLCTIREATLQAERFNLVLFDESGKAVIYPLNLMSAIVPSWQSRRRGFNIYEKISVNFE